MGALKQHHLNTVEEVRALLSRTSNYQIVSETINHITIACINRRVSRPLAFAINDLGHAVEVRAGLNTSRVYLRVHLTQPLFH